MAKQPFIILSYMSILVHCISRYTAGGIHIESYLVLALSCKSIKVWWSSLLEHCLIPTCGGIIVSIILSSLGQCSNNDDHHTFIYLQLNVTTRYLEQRYDSIWMPPAVYRDVQWSSVAMTSKKDKPWKHHASYLTIMQSSMTMNAQVMYMMMMEVAWQYISEWLWKCHNR